MAPFGFRSFLITVLLMTSCSSSDEEIVAKLDAQIVGVDVSSMETSGSLEITSDGLRSRADASIKTTDVETDTTDDVETDSADTKKDISPACVNKSNCDDKNPCTEDGCDLISGQCVHEPQLYIICDDKNPCTDDDRCDDHGECAGTKKTKCFDGNPCTTDLCDPEQGGCVFTNLEAPCNDGNQCTKNDVCVSGVCSGTQIVCDDKNPCTSDLCDTKSGCAYVIESNLLCDDNNACTNADLCVNGLCKGTTVNCGDGNACTTDSCDKGTGCYSTPAANNTSCTDSDACTLKDVCVDSVCKSGSKKNCDDNNICTSDACDSSDGKCVYEVKTGIHYCDDNNACTDTDTCKLGTCTGKIVQCYDGNDCTLDKCDIKSGCLYIAQDKAPCDDGNKCTLGDICAQTQCEGKVIICSDGNACTNDTCDPAIGKCNFTAINGFYCNDGNACTISDVCEGVTCAGKTIACNDGNPCTDDSCNPKTGCFFVPTEKATCNDGNLCTKDDICIQSVCVGKPTNCDDGNSCTLDVCDKTNGICVHTQSKDGYVCNDNDACTYADVCTSGKCNGTVNDCNDFNECTKDACNPQNGKCVYTQIPNCPS